VRQQKKNQSDNLFQLDSDWSVECQNKHTIKQGLLYGTLTDPIQHTKTISFQIKT